MIYTESQIIERLVALDSLLERCLKKGDVQKAQRIRTQMKRLDRKVKALRGVDPVQAVVAQEINRLEAAHKQALINGDSFAASSLIQRIMRLRVTA